MEVARISQPSFFCNTIESLKAPRRAAGSVRRPVFSPQDGPSGQTKRHQYQTAHIQKNRAADPATQESKPTHEHRAPQQPVKHQLAVAWGCFEDLQHGDGIRPVAKNPHQAAPQEPREQEKQPSPQPAARRLRREVPSGGGAEAVVTRLNAAWGPASGG